MGVEVTHTAETSVAYETGACDVCTPVMCYDGQLQIFECERFLSFWSWTTIDTVWIPRSRPVLSLNCIKNDPRCGCEEKQALAPGFSVNDRVALTEPPFASKLLRTANFRVSPLAAELGPQPPAQIADLAAQQIEEFVRTAVGDSSRLPHQAGVLRRDGSFSWIVDETGLRDRPRLTLLSTDCSHALRLSTVIRERPERRLPILAVGPCMPGVQARVTVSAAKPAEQMTRQIFTGNAEVRTGQVTTIWTEVDVSELPNGSRGVFSVDLIDEKDKCIRASITEPFSIREMPRG